MVRPSAVSGGAPRLTVSPRVVGVHRERGGGAAPELLAGVRAAIGRSVSSLAGPPKLAFPPSPACSEGRAVREGPAGRDSLTRGGCAATASDGAIAGGAPRRRCARPGSPDAAGVDGVERHHLAVSPHRGALLGSGERAAGTRATSLSSTATPSPTSATARRGYAPSTSRAHLRCAATPSGGVWTTCAWSKPMWCPRPTSRWGASSRSTQVPSRTTRCGRTRHETLLRGGASASWASSVPHHAGLRREGEHVHPALKGRCRCRSFPWKGCSRAR